MLTPNVTRRSLILGGGAALLAAPALIRGQGTGFMRDPFALGVASGDPAEGGFVIWTRLAPDPLDQHGGMTMAIAKVGWEVASDPNFRTIVAKGEALARPEFAHSVHVEVEGLGPMRDYWYRFTAGGAVSRIGHARTTIAPGKPLDRLRFGTFGCQRWQDGLYTAAQGLAAADLDFLFHYGDFIYEYGGGTIVRPGLPTTPAVRASAGQECYSLDDYRIRYAQEMADPDLQALLAATPMYVTMDDHEVENNWAGLIDQENDPQEVFAFRRACAFQAWYEHMPVRKAQFPLPGAVRVHRSRGFGDLVQANFLDTRQFRTDQPCGDNYQPLCAGQDDPNATMMSVDEEAWLDRNLMDHGARWTLIGQQVMMMPIDRRQANEPQRIENMDSWAGYNVARKRMIARLAKRGDAIVVTGDEHKHYAGNLLSTDGAKAAAEFVGTSLSSGGDGSDPKPGVTPPVLTHNPELAFYCYRRGYLVCDVTRNTWRTDFMVVDQVSKPGGAISKRASFAVEKGSPVLHAA